MFENLDVLKETQPRLLGGTRISRGKDCGTGENVFNSFRKIETIGAIRGRDRINFLEVINQSINLSTFLFNYLSICVVYLG